MNNRKIFIYALLMLLMGDVSKALTQTGSISGFVYNAFNNPISGVEVCAFTATGTYFEQRATSQHDGGYFITNLPVGLYKIRVFNSSGYINEFYNDVYNQNEATTVKVNAGTILEQINFYLDQGGFVSGRIFTEDGKPLTSGIEIAFYDVVTKTLRGNTISDHQGYYVSPAIPFGPHIAIAGDTKKGYVITYYNDAANWDDADILTIASADTIKEINFTLKIGASISGTVSEENNQRKHIRAWIVVEDWDTGEWRSEAWSDSITGAYSAKGLREGKYRVHVFGVDPTKYHTQYYYHCRRKSDDNEPIYINKLTDIRVGIQFDLIPVTYQRVANEHIQISVGDNYPGSNLTIGTTGGLPDSHDDNKSLLFGHPYPNTSYTTISIDDKPYLFGASSGDYMYEGDIYTPENRIVPHVTNDGAGVTWGWICDNIKVEQTVTIVKSEWSEKQIYDTAKLRYVLRNVDNKPKVVGLRVLFDTMLGENDGAPIKTPDGIYTDHERDFHSLNVPAWWTAIEGDSTKTIFSAQGTMVDYGATPPDRFAIVKWQNVFPNHWDYQTNDTCKIIHDSGVALWWLPITLNKNETREIITYYGLGEMIPDTIPPYVHTLSPDSNTFANPGVNITLHVKDDYMGVDGKSLKMWVNGVPVTPDTTADSEKKDYTLSYNPPLDFKFNEQVMITVEAQDRAYTPNKMRTHYSFSIRNDLTPPYLDQIFPARDTTDVATNSDIHFHIKDDVSGVDKTSIVIVVNQDTVRNAQITGSPMDYLVYIDPVNQFSYNDTVNVRVSANDRANPVNSMTDQFQFVIKKDTDPPFLEHIKPAPDSIDVPIQAKLSFHIRDLLAGVDKNTLFIQVNDDSIRDLKIAGTVNDYLVEFSPLTRFHFNETIKVSVQADDFARPANHLNVAYSFHIKKDREAPYVTWLTPAPELAEAPVNSTVSFYLQDELAGVDKSTISFKMNDSLYFPQISGDSSRFYVVFIPENRFRYNQTITIQIDAADLAVPTNRMNTYEYLFNIEKDNQPPYITQLHPEPNATGVPLQTELSFHVLDDLAGVEKNSIHLLVDDTLRIPVISGDSSDFAVQLQQDNGFFYNDTVTVEINAHDMAEPVNAISPGFKYNFYVERDTVAPVIQDVIPAPFSLNVPLNTAISFVVTDEHSGVGFVYLKINGQNVECQKLSDNKYVYQPAHIFSENDTIKVEIVAGDRVKPVNSVTMPYYFITLTDTTPPVTADHRPGKNEKGVSLRPEITVSLTDDFTGVDSASIVMMVQDVRVFPELQPIAQGYELRYQPPMEFQYNAVIQVSIEAQDLANNPNKMKQDNYRFYTIEDHDPPIISELTPSLGDTGIVRNPLISFRLKDAIAGVDSTSIQLIINQQTIANDELIISGNKNDYLVTYQPGQLFDTGQLVQWRISAADFSHPPNSVDSTVFFTVTNRKDTAPPYIVAHHPNPDERNVTPGTLISFHIKDDYSGVDRNSIILRLNNEVVTPEITGTIFDYFVSYQPEDHFAYNDSVGVQIDAKDLALEPNIMQPARYLFYIETDVTPPLIVFTKPGAGAENISLVTDIVFDIFDDQLGVDSSSVVFKIDNEYVNFNLSGDKFHYTLTCNPIVPFDYNQTVSINLKAADFSVPANEKDSLFIFRTIEDREPPYITQLRPMENEVQVDFYTTISFHIQDNIAGVDSASIELKVDNHAVNFQISGSPGDYAIFFKPEYGFSSGQLVHVSIKAKDLSKPANQMTPKDYSFKIRDILPDLQTTLAVDSQQVIVHHTVTLVAEVINQDAPILTPFTVILQNGDQVIKSETINNMSINEVTTVIVPLTLHHERTYNIRVFVDSESRIPESNEQNNSAEIQVEAIEGKLIVRSNPFTPNGDGYNDYVGFDFKEFSLNTPMLKIFDFQGRDIIILDEYTQSKFIWDGRDHQKHEAQPGVYLYILQDGARNVARGYVVLAR